MNSLKTIRRKFRVPSHLGEAPQFFTDLLSHWYPPGHRIPEQDSLGLRLFVRDGYLSFYRKGQAIAAEIRNGRNWSWKIHRAYLGEDAANVQADSSGYVKVVDSASALRNGSILYPGHEALKRWIETTNGSRETGRNYIGQEKAFVDALVANNSAIDVELVLSGPGSKMATDKKTGRPRSTPTRADLVWLDQSIIRFAEVKLMTNTASLRKGDQSAPNIEAQIQNYSDWLALESNQAAMRAACIATAEVLQKLNNLLPGHKPLPDDITALARGTARELVIDERFWVVVLDNGGGPSFSTNGHSRRLTERYALHVVSGLDNDTELALRG